MRRILKKIVLLAAVMSMVGCEQFVLDMLGYHEQQIPISFDTYYDAWKWVATNITYVRDGTEEWQTPEETYRRRKGDCEDFAILLLFFVKDIEPSARMCVIEWNDGPPLHAVLKIGTRYLEPQGYMFYMIPSQFTVRYSYDYEEALKQSFYRAVE